MRVLLTGSAGFVGSHLHAELDRRGADVTAIDLVDGVDCLDLFRADRTRFDLAIHCAAVVGGRANIDGSPLSVATNLALDSWFFRWLQLSGTRRAVYFSSSAVYPVDLQDDWATTRLLRESDVRADALNYGRPDQTYGLAKLAGEVLGRHAMDSGIPVHVFRPLSGYGSDQSSDYPFAAFIDRALRRDDPFEVWGDGQQVRDWVHIDDIVATVFAALDQDARGPLNVCTGRATSFNQLAEMVTSAAGYRPTIKHLPAAPTGMLFRVGEPTTLNTLRPARIPLEEGIARALRERRS